MGLRSSRLLALKYLQEASSEKQIGEMSKGGDYEIRWKIPDIFSYSEVNKWYRSPTFCTTSCGWYLKIYPNGKKRTRSFGWVSLYLMRRLDPWIVVEDYDSSPQAANFTFGLMKRNGEIQEICDLSWLYHREEGFGFGTSKFIRRSELMERNSELVPSDDLTIVFTLWLNPGEELSFERRDTDCGDVYQSFIFNGDSDVRLRVQREEFPVHKSVLSACSPVFAAMFDVDMQERTTGIVEIADCDPTAFRDFLEFAYCKSIAKIKGDVFQLYKISDKYDVRELKSDCLIYIMSTLTPENFGDVFVFGYQTDSVSLKSKCHLYFMRNSDKVIGTPQWDYLVREHYYLAGGLVHHRIPRQAVDRSNEIEVTDQIPSIAASCSLRNGKTFLKE